MVFGVFLKPKKKKKDIKKKHNEKIIKDNILRDIRLILNKKRKKIIMSLKESIIFGIIIISIMKVMVIKIETNYLMNILTILNLI